VSASPTWIPTAIVVVIHERLIAEHGGATGIRDHGLLDSALAGPQNHFHYGTTDLVELAAVYALALCRNHPFVDGNKRVAFVVAITFLELNGLRFSAPEPEVVVHTLALAAHEIGSDEYAEWMRTHTS
jgi:death on curing protein